MKISVDPTAFYQSGDKSPHSKEVTAPLDEETLENDVNYGIADCRKRIRSQRSSLRAQHHPPIDGSNGDSASCHWSCWKLCRNSGKRFDEPELAFKTC